MALWISEARANMDHKTTSAPFGTEKSTTFKITSCQAHQKLCFSCYICDLKLYWAIQQYQNNRHISDYYVLTHTQTRLQPRRWNLFSFLCLCDSECWSGSCLMVCDRLNCYKPHILGRDEWSAWWEGWQMNQSRSSLLVLSLRNEKDSQAPGRAWVSNLSTKQLSVHLSHCETSRLSHSDCVWRGEWAGGWLCARENKSALFL